MTDERRRLRIFFLNCPHLDHLAATDLLVSQNEHQRLFEFETYSFWILPAPVRSRLRWRFLSLAFAIPLRPAGFSAWLEGQRRAMRDLDFAPEFAAKLGLERALDIARSCIARHDEWLKCQPPDYGNWSIRYGPAVIVTETPIQGRYLSVVGEDVAVITIAEWDRRFAPPSVLEFVLSNVQRAAIRMLLTTKIGSHYPTRGCVWDFTATVEDARISVSSGYLCGTCREAVRDALDEEEVRQLEVFLRNDWVGTLRDNTSVASDLKRIFGYDLSRTRGLSPSFGEKLWESIRTKAIEHTIITVLTVLLGIAVTALGIKSFHEQPPPQPSPPTLKNLGIAGLHDGPKDVRYGDRTTLPLSPKSACPLATAATHTAKFHRSRSTALPAEYRCGPPRRTPPAYLFLHRRCSRWMRHEL
jgi:hypothetical protein